MVSAHTVNARKLIRGAGCVGEPSGVPAGDRLNSWPAVKNEAGRRKDSRPSICGEASPSKESTAA